MELLSCPAASPLPEVDPPATGKVAANVTVETAEEAAPIVCIWLDPAAAAFPLVVAASFSASALVPVPSEASSACQFDRKLCETDVEEGEAAALLNKPVPCALPCALAAT
jgi:hypothetical protein